MRIFKIGVLLLQLLPVISSGQTLTEKKISQLQHEIQYLNDTTALRRNELERLKLQRIREMLHLWVLPAQLPSETLVTHSAMVLVYSEKHEQAKWVAHIITTDVAEGKIGRSNDFRPDPLIATGSAVESDYFVKKKQANGKYKYEGFGYDRGHLAPSADFRWSATALSESYYYSNMSPQVPAFNRVCWAKLENLLRSYVDSRHAELAVITGPVLRDDLPKIEKTVNKPSIPAYYYKVALDAKNKRAIAFIMPNSKCTYSIDYYAVSVDSVERLTGIDFFPKLDDKLEDSLEALCKVSEWMGNPAQGEVVPIDPTTLPRNHFNTVQAKLYVGRREVITVCGTVVSTKLSANGNVFLNLDKAFPDQIFTVTIFKAQMKNFSYSPEEELMGKTICVEGMVVDFNGVASMVLENEKSVRILSDE